MNGHGAVDQVRILNEIAAEESHGHTRVLYFVDFWTEEGPMKTIGHADRYESAMTMHNVPDLVHMGNLPATGKLKCRDHGIVDADTFEFNPTPDFTTREDPREATPELGREIFERTVRTIGSVLRQKLNVQTK